jgi:hypothetical protein
MLREIVAGLLHDERSIAEHNGQGEWGRLGDWRAVSEMGSGMLRIKYLHV